MSQRLAFYCKILLGIVTIILLCLGYRYIKYTPFVRSQPKHYIMLHGHIDPALKNRFRFYLNYGNQNKTCDDFFFNLGFVQKTIPLYYTPRYYNNNEYSIKIPTDGYYQGLCGWAPFDFGYIVDSTPYLLQLFNTNENTAHNKNIITATCEPIYKLFLCHNTANSPHLITSKSPLFRFYFKAYKNEKLTLNIVIPPKIKS